MAKPTRMTAELPPRPTGLLLAEVEAERARMQQVLEDEAARERAEAFLAERLREKVVARMEFIT